MDKDSQSGDVMVLIALLLGRGEALTVAAMLDAAGIIVHVGAEHHSSASATVVGLGGFRLTVPAWQYDDASAVLAEMLAMPEPPPSMQLRRSIARLLAAMTGSGLMLTLPYALVFGIKILMSVLYTPLLLLQIPVNPQGRGDYYLSARTMD